ncbi:MAG: hypothetical protein NXI04_26280 [Planctomycetaceae bacterium]|nr:hypothetical protein [Planctomycetaceae bacterium]
MRIRRLKVSVIPIEDNVISVKPPGIEPLLGIANHPELNIGWAGGYFNCFPGPRIAAHERLCAEAAVWDLVDELPNQSGCESAIAADGNLVVTGVDHREAELIVA